MPNNEYKFLDTDTVLYYHQKEIERSVGDSGIRDPGGLDAALNAPKATYGGDYLMDVFEMAATYIVSMNLHHPFIDGNKRISLLCAVDFLQLNGYEFSERKPNDLAKIILQFIKHDIEKDDVAEYFKLNSRVLD